jgi:hypothetical protein
MCGTVESLGIRRVPVRSGRGKGREGNKQVYKTIKLIDQKAGAGTVNLRLGNDR